MISDERARGGDRKLAQCMIDMHADSYRTSHSPHPGGKGKSKSPPRIESPVGHENLHDNTNI